MKTLKNIAYWVFVVSAFAFVGAMIANGAWYPGKG